MLKIRTSTAALADGRTMASRWLDKTDEAFHASVWAGADLNPPPDMQADFVRRVARNRIAAAKLHDLWDEDQRVAPGDALYITTIYLLDDERIGVTGITLTPETAKDLLLVLAPAHRGQGHAERILQMGSPLLYDVLGAPLLEADVIHATAAARALARKRGAKVEAAITTPLGRPAHHVSQSAAANRQQPRLDVRTAWRTEPDSYAPFAVSAPAPAFNDGLRPPKSTKR